MSKTIKLSKNKTLKIFSSPDVAIDFALKFIIKSAKKSIEQKGCFSIALSGGKTPLDLYKRLCRQNLKWSKVRVFWSDERLVPLNNEKSNYFQAMEAGFKNLPLRQIFPMTLKEGAKKYEKKINSLLGKDLFDLVLLGIGEDGHTASLFPGHFSVDDKNLVTLVQRPTEKRLSLTLRCINQSQKVLVLVFGKEKNKILKKIYRQKENLPILLVKGKKQLLFLSDLEAASKIIPLKKTIVDKGRN